MYDTRGIFRHFVSRPEIGFHYLGLVGHEHSICTGEVQYGNPDEVPVMVHQNLKQYAHQNSTRLIAGALFPGDFAAAKERYEKIVTDFPDSRDGLLGLGAIAMYEYDRERAFAIYSRLLTIDPKNSIAKTALINLAGEAGQINRESSIKLMLHDNPESSFLYFTLGNVYASQSRWAEAQQAFFDAYRFDSTNPDYALNLAIALDRLGQIESALDYYNTALNLSAGKQVVFNEAKVLARIETISANLN